MSSIKFRYDINALRTLAVLAVVLFHYKVPGFSGGFVGVDIFFVISGYLMTRIVVEGQERDNFSLMTFYQRRFDRIVPALCVLILALLVIGYFIFFPSDYQLNTTYSIYSLLFVSNIYYWMHSGYFDPASETNILLHTWSLSVEWQFYLLYPIGLVLARKVGIVSRKAIFYLLAGLFVFSMTLCLYISSKNAGTSFYLFPTRSWEMIAGGLAFFLEGRVFKRYSSSIRAVFAIVGYSVLFLCVFLISEDITWPGIITGIPVCATGIILVANVNSFRVLSNSVVQFCGKSSYSFYLWHWPVYVIFQYLGYNSIRLIPIMFVLSFVFAIVSYVYIESTRLKTKTILISSGFSLAVLVVFANFELNSIVYDKATLSIADYEKRHKDEKSKQFRSGKCFITDPFGYSNYDFNVCLGIDHSKRNVLLMGDSHGAHFSQSFTEECEKRNINLMQVNASGCFPVIDARGREDGAKLIKYVYNNFIKEHFQEIDLVILSANWVNLYKDKERLTSEISRTVEYLSSLGLKVIIIGQSETYTLPYPSIAARSYFYRTDYSEAYLNRHSKAVNNLLKQKFADIYVDIFDINGNSKLSDNNVPYMFDQNHFTKYGADKVTKYIFGSSFFKNQQLVSQ